MARNVRIAFSATGRAAWLSHLDLMALFPRAFTRAGLPLLYTEGFNPHADISLALPLPVGFESECERLDFGLEGTPDFGALPALINAALPAGIIVTAAGPVSRPACDIAFAGYEMRVETTATPERAAGVFSGEVFVDKRAKKGCTVRTDIMPMIRSVGFERAAGGLVVRAAVTAQNPTLNPEYIADVWRERLDPEAAFRFKRTGIFGRDGLAFDGL